MADPLTSDGFKIDRASQKMLLALNKRGRRRGSSLRESGELSQNTQVFYRMEEHLIPSGLVEEHDRRHEQDQRRFSLTDEGRTWLDAHSEEVAMPKTRVETQEMAHEALKEASSAKVSVQNYRQKVSRMDDKVDDVEDEWEDWQKDKGDSFDQLFFRTKSLREDSDDNTRSIEEVESDVSHLGAQREEFVKNVGSRLGEQEETIAELREENTELRRELGKLQKDVDGIIEEMDRSVSDRLRQRFGDD